MEKKTTQNQHQQKPKTENSKPKAKSNKTSQAKLLIVLMISNFIWLGLHEWLQVIFQIFLSL